MQHQGLGPSAVRAGEGDEFEDEHDTEPSEDEEELNLRFFGIRQALPIPEGDPDWDAGPPETAEEYLRRVRAEAAACPRVVRVEFDAEAHAAKQRSREAAEDAEAATAEQHGSLTTDFSEQAQHVAGTSSAAVQHGVAAVGLDQKPLQGEPSMQSLHSQQASERTTGAGAARRRQQPVRVAGYVSRLLAAGTLQEGPDWAQPSHTWVRQLVSDFKSMRLWLAQASESHAHELQRSAQLPPVQDDAAWDQICFGGRALSMGPSCVHVRHCAAVAPIPTTTTNAAQGSKHSRKRHHHTRQQQQQQHGVGHMQQEQLDAATAAHVVHSQHHHHQQQQQQQLLPALLSQQSGATEPPAAGGDVAMSQAGSLSPAGSTASISSMDQIALPVLSSVLCIDQVGVSTLLQRMVGRMVASTGPLNEPESQWLFALAAMLEKPAHSDVVAALRSLTRWLAVARSSVVDAGDPQLPRINTLAVVAGAYFGQDEKLVRWVADMDLP